MPLSATAQPHPRRPPNTSSDPREPETTIHFLSSTVQTHITTFYTYLRPARAQSPELLAATTPPPGLDSLPSLLSTLPSYVSVTGKLVRRSISLPDYLIAEELQCS